jgi:hypothetical protein
MRRLRGVLEEEEEEEGQQQQQEQQGRSASLLPLLFRKGRSRPRFSPPVVASADLRLAKTLPLLPSLLLELGLRPPLPVPLTALLLSPPQHRLLPPLHPPPSSLLSLPLLLLPPPVQVVVQRTFHPSTFRTKSCPIPRPLPLMHTTRT